MAIGIINWLQKIDLYEMVMQYSRGKEMNHNIIFTHFGATWYLKNALRIARKNNSPLTDVILLGDESNIDIAQSCNCRWYPFHLYADEKSQEIEEKYVHIGSAPRTAYSKHKHNFLRWFYIKNFMKVMKIDNVWAFDSDTLISRNISDIENVYNMFPMYTSNSISGCGMRVNSLQHMEGLCETIYEKYFDKDFREYHYQQIEGFRQKGKLYNLSDMTMIGEYGKKVQVGELSNINNEGSMFDWNISSPLAERVPGNTIRYEMEGKHKKVVWNKSIPYFKVLGGPPVRVNSLNMSWCNEAFWSSVLGQI
jgi:hypothetical protein